MYDDEALGRTGYRAVPCARCYSEGDVQAAHTTPQAISRLQFRVFIRNRLRGANVAQSKVLRGGRRGRRSGEAEKRRSGEAEKRRIGGSETQDTRGTTFVCWPVGVPESVQGAQSCNLPPVRPSDGAETAARLTGARVELPYKGNFRSQPRPKARE